MKRVDIQIVEKMSKITSTLASTTRELHKKNLALAKAKKMLEEQEKMIIAQSRFVAMNELLLMISHQWRQPLNIISLYTQKILLQISQEESCDTKMLESELHNIQKTTQTLSSTIDIFSSQLTKDQPVRMSVSDVLDDVSKLVLQALSTNNIKTKYNLHCHAKISIIPSILIHISLIIIQNAIDAFEKKDMKDKKFIVESYDEEKNILITYQDNAGGIEEEILEKVYEPYFSTKQEQNSVGLGLYIAKLLVLKIFHGTIDLQNKEGGLHVSIRIPYREHQDEA